MKNVFLPEEAVEKMENVYEILDYSNKTYKDKICYQQIQKRKDDITITFGELKQRVDFLRIYLARHGLIDNHFAIIGETSIDWITVYLAIISGVGVCVPISKDLDEESIITQINYADVDVLFVSKKCVKKIKKILDKCPNVKQVIVMCSDENVDLEDQINLSSIIKEGYSLLEKNELPALDSMKTCCILFTSGTTGVNKGVMLSNHNIMGTLRGCATLLHYPETSFSVLPINHSYELNAHLMSSLYCGTCVYINNDMKYILKNLQKYKPQMSCMVPMMLDLIVHRIKSEIRRSGKEKTFNKLVHLSNMLLKVKIDVRRRLFAQVLDSLGGHLDMIICGGAALNEDTIDFLYSIGINVYNGYGITECSPVAAVNAKKLVKKNSVGRVLPTLQARIVNVDSNGNGEIEFYGDNVMQGYYKADEDTKAVFCEDGWFKTGDIGHLDKDNYLYICGRLKNLIILPNGENVYPEEIEENIMSGIPFIKEIVVAENKKNNGLFAYIYIDPDYIDSLKEDEDITKLLKQALNQYNSTEPGFKRINDFEISFEPFEKNVTQKILRHKVIN